MAILSSEILFLGMQFIVYDIEATCWDGRPPGLVQETIEIGALKLNAYGEVISQFSRLIRPELHPQLSLFCKKLTQIDQVDINRSKPFPDVIESFKDWIDIWEDEYLLCAWGNFDQIQLQRDCYLHRLEDEWLDPFINLKRQYQELRKLTKPAGLQKTVSREGFEFTGQLHSALADAENLTKVFVKLRDMWRY